MKKPLSALLTFALAVCPAACAENTSATRAAVVEVTESGTFTGSYSSSGANENVFYVTGGTADIHDAQLSRVCENAEACTALTDSGACVLITGGEADLTACEISTDASGSTGIFVSDSGDANVNSCTVTTLGGFSAGICAADGGRVYASDVSVTANGASSPAVAVSGGTAVISGGSWLAYGTDAPGALVGGDLTVSDATIGASAGTSVQLRSGGIARLNASVLTGGNASDGAMSCAVDISGDDPSGFAAFEMDGGTIVCSSGPMFSVSGTGSAVTLLNVSLMPAEDSETLMRCTGGANCVLTAIEQRTDGNIVCGSDSQVQLYLTGNSCLTGTFLPEEDGTEAPAAGPCSLYIDDSSAWVVTESCTLDTLACAGIITDTNGSSVTVIGTDGNTYVEGTGAYTVTVSRYSAVCDTAGANAVNAY